MVKEKLESTKSRIKFLQKIQVAPQLSKEQDMLQEMFSHRDTMWGTGESLPKLEGNLNPNILGYDEDETAQSFGIGRIRGGTGQFFGI